MRILQNQKFTIRGFKDLPEDKVEYAYRNLFRSITDYYLAEKKDINKSVYKLINLDNDVVKLETSLTIIDSKQWEEFLNFIRKIINDYIPENSQTKMDIESEFHKIYTGVITE